MVKYHVLYQTIDSTEESEIQFTNGSDLHAWVGSMDDLLVFMTITDPMGDELELTDIVKE